VPYFLRPDRYKLNHLGWIFGAINPTYISNIAVPGSKDAKRFNLSTFKP